MGLGNLFRPKWKHSDPSIRSAAIKEMGLEEIQTLFEIAQSDPEHAVRKAAIKQIDSPDELDRLVSRLDDRELTALAARRAESLRIALACGPGGPAAEAAASQLEGSDALIQVLNGQPSEGVQSQIVSRLGAAGKLYDVLDKVGSRQIQAVLIAAADEENCASVAINHDRKEVCLEAMARVENLRLLERISKKARVKTVRNRARRKLEQAPQSKGVDVAEQLIKRRQARQVQMCSRAEELADLRDEEDGAWRKAADEVELLQAEWQQFSAGERLDGRFTRAVKRFETRFKVHQARDAKATQSDQAAKQAPAAEVRRSEPIETPAEAVETKQADEAEAAAREAQRAEQAAAQAAEAREKQAALDKAHAEAEQQLNAAIERLRGVVDSDRIKDIDRALSDAKKQFSKLAKDLEASVREKLETLQTELASKLGGRLDELRQSEDWKRWANTKRRQELCAEAEVLAKGSSSTAGNEDTKAETPVEAAAAPETSAPAASEAPVATSTAAPTEATPTAETQAPTEDLAEVAKRIRKLQSAWKKVGPATRDQADVLWERFKTACDAAYERCKPYFAEQDLQRQENLKTKQELCVKAESVADLDAWDEGTKTLKALQAEWKKVGPVPRAESDAIWKRFRAACDKFFDRRKDFYRDRDAERKGNLGLKRKLCEEAEAVKDSQEWDVTAEQLKDLQRQWKAIGPVPRKHADAIWKRFRAACDHFFEARNGRFDGERAENLRERDRYCRRLEYIAGIESPPLPAQADPVAQVAEAPAPDAEAPVADVESAAAEAAQAPASAPEPELDIPTDDEGIKQAVLSALDIWPKLGRVARDQATALEKRFEKAWHGVVAKHALAFAGTAIDPAKNRQRKIAICDELKTLLDRYEEEKQQEQRSADGAIDPEQAAQALREALAANALGTNQQPAWDAKVAKRELQQAVREWQRIGPIAQQYVAELDQRFAQTSERLKEMIARG